ncbi:protein of unknown function [Pararobbsia alpina]
MKTGNKSYAPHDSGALVHKLPFHARLKGDIAPGDRNSPYACRQLQRLFGLRFLPCG